MPGKTPGGLPHSETPRSQAASASLGHFAAWPRPSSAANAKASTMRPSTRPLYGRRYVRTNNDNARSRTGARPRDLFPRTSPFRPASFVDHPHAGFPAANLHILQPKVRTIQ